MLADLGQLSGREKAEATLQGLGRDLPSFILDSGYFITKDEHANGLERPIPNKPYLRHYLHELATEQFVVVVKSRQTMFTWGTLCYLLAVALTRKNQLIICQTKREEDVINVLMSRVYFLYDHLPNWIKTIRPRTSGNKQSASILDLPEQGSRIWGIPQGADVIRSNTVSILFADEVDFQPEAAASVRAATPSLVGGGQGIWVSTPSLTGILGKLVVGEWE